MISRRLMHIENMQIITSEWNGVYRFTLEIHDTDEAIRKLMLQIDKQVEVFKSFYNTDAEILWQQHDMFVRKNTAGSITPGSAAEIERSVVA
jgi:acetolactate synthase-1/3 small subunit